MREYTGSAYHGTTTAHGLKSGDVLEDRGIGINEGCWATDDYEAACEYAVAASVRDGGDPVVFEVHCEDCVRTHDNTCWAYCDRFGGTITIRKKSRRKIQTPWWM